MGVGSGGVQCLEHGRWKLFLLLDFANGCSISFWIWEGLPQKLAYSQMHSPLPSARASTPSSTL